MDNYTKYKELREKFGEFVYESYEIDETDNEIILAYNFSIKGLSDFRPEWRIPKKKENGAISEKLIYFKKESEENLTLKKLIFSLGMIELISYWKIACPERVIIKAGLENEEITENELLWWKEQYFYGLGEFFHTNKIPLDKDGFMKLSAGDRNLKKENANEKTFSHKNVYEFTEISHGSHSALIPVGGGKDSVVSLELLKDFNENNYCFMINGRGATFNTAEAAGFNDDKIIVAKRTLDSRMLALNKEGYLNGHTPFSAMAAFSSVLIAYIYGLPYVVLSNEASANESTVEGSEVNHQYSKSYKFEEDFVNYEKKYIDSRIKYFSLLRGWSEYRIAKNFAKHTKYHKIFRSCNVGSKKDEWCASCAKCLFVFLILSPFLSIEKLTEIFGKDMVEDEAMIPIMDKLIGEVPEKPFECVGSRNEINLALCETIRELENGKVGLPLLFKHYKTTGAYKKYKNVDGSYLMDFNEENGIPDFLKDRVR